MKISTLYSLGLLGIIFLLISLRPTKRVIEIFSDDNIIEFSYLNNIEVNTDIVLVNTAYQNEDTIKKWVKNIVAAKPKVIYVDLLFDTIHTPPELNEKIILPVGTGRKGETVFSKNIFSKSEQYASSLGTNQHRSEFVSNINGEIFENVSIAIVKEFDKDRYDKIINSGKEFINQYKDGNIFYVLNWVSTDSTDNMQKELFKNKIVILGFLGDGSSKEPYTPTDSDYHETPAGLKFGAYIIASEVHTLLGDMITEIPKYLIFLISVPLFIISFWMAKFNSTNRLLLRIFFTNVITVITLSGLLTLSIIGIAKLNLLISIWPLAIAIILGVQIGILRSIFMYEYDKRHG